jgi:plastocyanin
MELGATLCTHQPTTHRRRLVGLAASVAFGLTACGASAGTTSASPAAVDPTSMVDMPTAATGSAPAAGPAVTTDKVTINNFAFMPAAVTVKTGTTVTWTNMDEEPHTVVDGAHGVKSPVMGNQGATFTYTFTTPGTYTYNCSIHPFMSGTVEVTA